MVYGYCLSGSDVRIVSASVFPWLGGMIGGLTIFLGSQHLQLLEENSNVCEFHPSTQRYTMARVHVNSLSGLSPPGVVCISFLKLEIP